ncbi:MAG: hypothetical protein ACR2O4_11605 [Hyphomicrobiaceae bacterium]
MLLYLKALYILSAILFTAFIKLSVGLPVKDMQMLMLCGLFFLACNRAFVTFLLSHSAVVAIFPVLVDEKRSARVREMPLQLVHASGNALR